MSDTKEQQILGLGRLGWTLRQIEEATGIRRETASGYLKAAGIEIRGPRRRGDFEDAAPARPSSWRIERSQTFAEA